LSSSSPSSVEGNTADPKPISCGEKSTDPAPLVLWEGPGGKQRLAAGMGPDKTLGAGGPVSMGQLIPPGEEGIRSEQRGIIEIAK
jgi:hypothetical protein